jgi:hypothetical protein
MYRHIRVLRSTPLTSKGGTVKGVFVLVILRPDLSVTI